MAVDDRTNRLVRQLSTLLVLAFVVVYLLFEMTILPLFLPFGTKGLFVAETAFRLLLLSLAFLIAEVLLPRLGLPTFAQAWRRPEQANSGMQQWLRRLRDIPPPIVIGLVAIGFALAAWIQPNAVSGAVFLIGWLPAVSLRAAGRSKLSLLALLIWVAASLALLVVIPLAESMPAHA